MEKASQEAGDLQKRTVSVWRHHHLLLLYNIGAKNARVLQEWNLRTFLKNFVFFKNGLDKRVFVCYNLTVRAIARAKIAAIAQLVEHMLGKHEVISSTLISSSRAQPLRFILKGFSFIKLLTKPTQICYTIYNVKHKR